MFDKLEDILFRYDEVLKELSEPEVLNDAPFLLPGSPDPW